MQIPHLCGQACRTIAAHSTSHRIAFDKLCCHPCANCNPLPCCTPSTPLQPVSPKSGLAGAAALSALKRSLGGVLEVLLPAYGPGVAQQLVDTSKGYALLLRQQEQPVTAALLDVYGQVRRQWLREQAVDSCRC